MRASNEYGWCPLITLLCGSVLLMACPSVDRSSALSGVATLEGQADHSGIQVNLSINGQGVGATSTTPDGHYRFHNLSRVDYTLTFSKQGFGTVSAEATWTGVVHDPEPPEVVLPAIKASVEGQIVSPIEDIAFEEDGEVVLESEAGPLVLRAEAGGRFGDAGLLPGFYGVEIRLKGHQPLRFTKTLKAGHNDLGELVLEPVEIAMVGRVVTIVAEAGINTTMPMEQVGVRLRRGGQLVATTFTDETGSFVFESMPLAYTLTLNAPDFLPQTYDIEADAERSIFTRDGEPLSLEVPFVMVRAPESDRDGDGVIDALDNCPEDFNPDRGDLDGDGLGDTCDEDADNDGLINGLDNCPLSFNPMQEDLLGRGRGVVCSGGTLDWPFVIGCRVTHQRVDSFGREDNLQGSCGGAGAPELVYELPELDETSLLIKVQARHSTVLYVLDEYGREVGCRIGNELGLPGEGFGAIHEGYRLVIDGFSGPQSSGPVELNISSTLCEPGVQEGSRTELRREPRSIAVSDLNGDQILDVIISGHDRVTVFPGNGRNFSSEPQTLEIQGDHTSTGVADVNGDRHPDIVIASTSEGGSGVTVFLGQGDGTFQESQRLARVGPAISISLADINGDAQVDILTAGGGGIGVATGLREGWGWTR